MRAPHVHHLLILLLTQPMTRPEPALQMEFLRVNLLPVSTSRVSSAKGFWLGQAARYTACRRNRESGDHTTSSSFDPPKSRRREKSFGSIRIVLERPGEPSSRAAIHLPSGE